MKNRSIQDEDSEDIREIRGIKFKNKEDEKKFSKLRKELRKKKNDRMEDNYDRY